MEKSEFIAKIKNNGFLASFQGGSGYIINNLLHHSANSLNQCATLQNGIIKTYTQKLIYQPITMNVVKNIIELDQLFLASKDFNTTSLTVYRGGTKIDESSLSGVVSTSTDIDTAVDFYHGALFKIVLPAGSQYLFQPTRNNCFDSEQEVVLPPCKFEIKSKSTLYHKSVPVVDFIPYNFYDIKVFPQSLAKCVLKSIENPPDDYTSCLLDIEKEDCNNAKVKLKEYVKSQY